jgi:prolyl-tRNA synthetase
MTHGDNQGLIMPPAVAPQQVVIVPIPHKEVEPEKLEEYANSIARVLRKSGIRTKVSFFFFF